MLLTIVPFLAKTVLYIAIGTGVVALTAIVTKPKLETIDEEIKRQMQRDAPTPDVLSSLPLVTKTVKDTEFILCRAAKVQMLGKTYGMIGAFGSWFTVRKN